MPRSVASDEPQGPKSSYEVYRAEGDALLRHKHFKESIEMYNLALELKPDDPYVLVQRSQCYLSLGMADTALIDVDKALAPSQEYYKAIFQKAEVLFFLGHFEKALVLYHRGNKIRPQFEGFRLGIQKAEESINNCIGLISNVKLTTKGDLKYFYATDSGAKKLQYQKIKSVKESKKKTQRVKTEISTRTIQDLLGALYKDRHFLEEILHYEDNSNSQGKRTKNSEKIKDLAVSGLNFLDNRLEFWQQQRPLCTVRNNEALKKKLKKSQQELMVTDHKRSQIILGILADLDQIDNLQTKSLHNDALKLCEKLRKHVEKWGEKVVPNEKEVLANIYALEGSSYFEMGEYNLSLQCHENDLKIGTKFDLPEIKSRALDNIGRVFAKQKDYSKAIEIWESKIPITKSVLESAWLFHEIGRCYLEMNVLEKASEYGERSLKMAEKSEERTWMLNSNVLIGQVALKMEYFENALEHFVRAEKFAEELENRAASKAINKAIEGIKLKLELGIDNIDTPEELQALEACTE